MMQPIEILMQAAKELQSEPVSRRTIAAQTVLSNVRLHLDWPELSFQYRTRHGSAVGVLLALIEKGE